MIITDEMRAEALEVLNQIRFRRGSIAELAERTGESPVGLLAAPAGLNWYQALSNMQPTKGELWGFMPCGPRAKRRPRGAPRKAWFACPRHERYYNLFRRMS